MLMILNCTIKTRMITRMDGAGGQVIDGGQSFDLCNFSLPFLILLQKMEKLNSQNF